MLRSPPGSGGFGSLVIQRGVIVRPQGGIIKVLVDALIVVKLHPITNMATQFSHVVVAVEPNFFILQATPEPFDENIVHPAALTIHADQNIVFLQLVDPVLSGKLTPLIGAKYLELTSSESHGIAQGSHTKPTVHGVAQFPA